MIWEKAPGMPVVLLCLLLFECARTAPTKMLQIDQRANNTVVVLAVGQTFEIVLPENPTTGFRWELKEAGQPACLPLGDSYEKPAAGALGRPGIRRWRFEAAQAGSGRIALVYRRAWEQDTPPAQVFRITAKVEKK